MAGGTVNRTLLEFFYQNPGEIYDDAKTEGAFDVVADQVDANWEDYAAVKTSLNSTTSGSSGSEYVKAPTIVGVAGNSVYAQIVDLVAQIQSIINSDIPSGSITYAKLASDVISAFVNTTGDTMTGDLLMAYTNGQIKGTAANLIISGASNSFVAGNAYIDETGWNRYDTGLASVLLNTNVATGQPQVRLASAGANPITWSNYLLYHEGYAPYAAGTYTGNGVATRDIALPFTPSAVIIMPQYPSLVNIGGTGSHASGGLAVTGSPVGLDSGGTFYPAVTVGANKFTVVYGADTNNGQETNTSGKIYNYIAFR